MAEFQLRVLDFNQPGETAAIAEVWNAACGPQFHLSANYFDWWATSAPGRQHAGQIAMAGGKPVGFILVSVLQGRPYIHPAEWGWIDCLAVHPDTRHRGLGGMLLDWGEAWHRKHGCTRVRIFGSLRPFGSGVPEELASMPFFLGRLYRPIPDTPVYWDVARDLGDGIPFIRKPYPEDSDLSPASDAEGSAVLDFLRREFPGAWLWEMEEFQRAGGRMEDVLLLRQAGQVEGFCWLTFPDSCRPLERYYMHRLPTPWGQLGPIGVSRDVRGSGWGGLLLQAGLETLQKRGVRGCLIDNTILLDFYGKYGFVPYRKYHALQKTIR